MARYFDPASPADRQLLPSSLTERTDVDLEAAALIAEATVIEAYTVSTYEAGSDAYALPYDWRRYGPPDPAAVKVGDYDWVCLRGYTVDAAQAEAGFRSALQREIAALIPWTVAQMKRDPAVSSETGTEAVKGKTLRVDAQAKLRSSFGFFLRRYDVRPVTWVT